MPRYDFVSPGGAAGNAIQQFLAEREAQRRQQLLDELFQQRQEADLALREEDVLSRRTQAQTAAARQAQLEAQATEDRQRAADERAAAQRQAENVRGVRGMIGEAQTQGPLTPETARTIGIMAYQEGITPPAEVTQMLQPPKRTVVQTVDAQGQPIRRAVTDEELAGGVPEYQAPDEAAGWQSAGSGVIFNPSTGEFRRVPGGRDDAGTGRTEQEDAAASYSSQTADRTITAIDDVLPKITQWTAGPGGYWLGKIPGTPAADVSAQLATVTGNIAFNALQQMRAASKTGGALGAVSERELDLLASVEGSIRQNQSPENLREQLGKIRASMERFKAAQAQMGRSGGGGGGEETPEARRKRLYDELSK